MFSLLWKQHAAKFVCAFIPFAQSNWLHHTYSDSPGQATLIYPVKEANNSIHTNSENRYIN